MAEVKLGYGETLENALRQFKRKVQQEDIIKEVERHSFYLKPGEKARIKAAMAVRTEPREDSPGRGIGKRRRGFRVSAAMKSGRQVRVVNGGQL